MTEKLLQYLWNFKIFTSFDFIDVEGNAVEILDFGKWNHDAGPDFLNAKIKTKNLVLAGNIELHTKASDWIFHGHSGDPAYENIILHAVYQNDTELAEMQQRSIPTLELRNYINPNILQRYEILMQEGSFIPCEQIFDQTKIPLNFNEEALLKKLYQKSLEIESSLIKNKNDKEAVLFQNIAYAFGLKVNAMAFRELAESIDFQIIRKVSQNQMQLEALFYGKSGWLKNHEDDQMQTWRREFEFLKTKFGLTNQEIQPKFLRLRPPNFPTLRLSQLANLYHREQNLFSKIINAEKSEDLFKIFDGISASEYWDGRFNFGKTANNSYKKNLTKDFVELIIINAILPVKYAYHKNQDEEMPEKILEFYRNLSAEKNTVVENWKKLGAEIKSALDSQAFVHHFKTMCEVKNCLNCSIGFKLLRT